MTTTVKASGAPWGEAAVEIQAVDGKAVAIPLAGGGKCRLCINGWTFPEVGGYSRAVRCSCQDLLDRVAALNAAELPAEAVGRDLASLHWARLAKSWALVATSDGMRRADLRRAILRFVDGWKPGRRGLLLEGSTGLGKTHVAYGLISALTLRHAVRCRFVAWADLLERLKDSFVQGARDRAAQSVVDQLCTVPLLVVDDLGGEYGTEWSAAVFANVISVRLQAGHTTVIGTNLGHALPREAPLSLKGRVGDRAFSRILEVCDPCTFVGEDYRTRLLPKAGDP